MSVTSSEAQTYPVQLYVYDLSNGLARSLSRQLTGRQFDAIYHTSIVVYSREWYFGQGIFNETPGRTHFGQPIQKIDLGQTSIDPATFQEILTDLRERYRADTYHLLQFNCNTFTGELSQILVGKDIPAHITSLPQDFLATPFGQMMGPQIDAMFRGGPSSAPPRQMANAPPSAMGILNNVTRSAMTNGHTNGAATSKVTVKPLQSVAHLEDLKRSAPSAVVMYTSHTCPPCVQMHPVYESIAEKYSEAGKYKDRPIVFGQAYAQSAQMLMQSEGISATPTFHFYAAGKRVNELKGANASSLEDAIEALLWSQYRPHPHSKLQNPADLVPRQAIKYKTIPNLMFAQQKLNDITSRHPAKSFGEKADIQEARSILTKTLFPWIHEGLAAGKQKAMSNQDSEKWIDAAQKTIGVLRLCDIFPIVDLVRIAVLDASQSEYLSGSDQGTKMLDAIWAKAKADMTLENKATLLTTFRLIGNILAATPYSTNAKTVQMARHVSESSDVIALLVFGVLSEDFGLRGAAVNAAFNRALLQSEGRSLFITAPKENDEPQSESDDEVELICAVLECVEKEQDLERLHRATAALLLQLYCAPSWHATLHSLLDVLEASQKLEQKVKLIKEDTSGKASDVCKLLEQTVRLIKAQ
ncbi:DUF862-domain-containing protein [Meira miltonrushii]|uniref:DUF862-domain-containing protein n=1 Tax=Meira miltonrushii TaxID=1280837 RepID=A0A316VD84_9BASI|nr:DUF862-domain-containing protein [Meira miltonrushii]PWN33445.1 DUF862-domain-containing protein [Meira miltonrushii]